MNKSLFAFVAATFLFVSCNNGGKNEKEESPADSISKAVVFPDKAKFDTVVDARPVTLFYLKNKNNFQAAVTNYGARMVGFILPGKDGKLRDIVVGFDNVKDYITAKERYYGCIVGRFGNRIAKGQFTLDDKTYQLDLNNGVNTLHGGRTGFHSRVWDAVQPDNQTLVLTYIAADGEEGYPGKMTTQVTYKLTDDNELQMSYEISTDKKTVVNVTNHNYWNLNGEGSGIINNHELLIKATTYTPVDSTLIPTGKLEPVAGTPFDFTTFHKIGERVEADNIQLRYGKGYDHNFVLDKGITTEPELITTLKGDLSGIVMDIYTTEPAIQFYGGNFMESLHTLKTGVKDDYRTALCLETQHYPDSPNQPAFPTTVLEPGKKYVSKTVHKFHF